MRLRELVCKTAYCTCGPVIEVAPNANPDPNPDPDLTFVTLFIQWR